MGVWDYPAWHPRRIKERRKPYNRFNDPKWRSPWSCVLCTKLETGDGGISDCVEQSCKYFPKLEDSDVRI